jgi:hypothetical protein
MNLRRASSLFTAAILTWALGPGSAGASMSTFTGTGSGSDGSLSAKAIITTGAGSLTVVLSNELAANVIRSQGQAVSDIKITLSNTAGTLGAETAAGQFGNISAGGLVTYTATDANTGDTTPISWFSGTGAGVSGSTVTLETIGGGQPSQMITPFIANGGDFGTVPSGITNFNSYVIGPATFTFTLAGVTSATKVTSATFSFGTGPDTFVPGVPEPSVFACAGTVTLFGLGLAWRRRKARAA